MEAAHPPQGEDNAVPGTVTLDCLRSVFRTRWQEAAGGRQQGRYEQLIASHRSAPRHARHPYTIVPFHLITPARPPTNARQDVGLPGAAEYPRLRSGFTNHSVQGEPATGYRTPRPTGHAAIDGPRCLAGTTTKENRSGPLALQPRSARKSRQVGRDDRLL